MTTKAQTKAAFAVIVAATEVIREAHEVPAGTLYAVLMAHGCDMETYRKVEAIIIGSGLVEKGGDLLRWIGPEVTK